MESLFFTTEQKFRRFAFRFLLFGVMLLMAGCGEKSKVSSQDNEPGQEKPEFHADYDIAMILRSAADALRVEEPLDSTEYDFEGVLTDGRGRPLYTDIQGAPGEWQIDVTTPTSIVIRNIYVGDLLPKDLEAYITGILQLTRTDTIRTKEFDNDIDTDLTVYNFDGGYLRFETRAAFAPNGLEGPLMSIIATKEPPIDMKQ